jgi:hypothetical protein
MMTTTTTTNDRSLLSKKRETYPCCCRCFIMCAKHRPRSKRSSTPGNENRERGEGGRKSQWNTSKKEITLPIIIIIIIINDYCIHLNSSPSGTAGLHFSLFCLILYSFASLSLFSPRQTRTIMFFFLKQRHRVNLSSLHTTTISLLYLSSPVCSYVPVK